MKKTFILFCLTPFISLFGQELNSSLIVGGNNVGAEEYQWMVELLYEDEHVCGAALIEPGWVITAGHCGLNLPADSIFAPNKVIINSTSLETAESFSEEILIDTIIPFPTYSITPPNTGFDDDIALIRLKTPSTFTPININNIDSNIVELQDTVVVLGWGLTSEMAESLSPNLLKAKPLVKNITPTKIYAGYDSGEDEAGAAAGDSGGPLFVNHSGNLTLVGVVSGSDDENSITKEGSPGRFTRVYGFKDWIQETIESFEPVSVVENTKNNEIEILNIDGNLHINLQDNYQEDFILSIVNLMGQVVESIRINGQVNSQYITLGTEVKGVYFVQSNKHNLNHKFIKY